MIISLTTNTVFAQHLLGTNIDRPAVDIACDQAMSTQDYENATKLCVRAAESYDDIVGRLAGYKHLKDSAFIVQEMLYNEAACLEQSSFAYKQLGDDINGRSYAVESFNVYDVSRMYFWGKINAAVGRASDDLSPIDYNKESETIKKKLASAISAKDVWIIHHFVELMSNLNRLYPGVLNSPIPSHTTNI